MNLDELMVVWRTQDRVPLYNVNQTLLHLALRQDEATLHKVLRLMRGIIYVASAGMVAAMALILANMIMLMIDRDDMKGLTGWDLALPVVGAAAALISARAVYVNHRAQSRHEQRFGESLRDQLKRSIGQLDVRATLAGVMLVIALLFGFCPMVLLLLLSRINGKSINDDGNLLVTFAVLLAASVASSVWALRKQAREVSPHNRRLEELLKELDGP